MRMRPSRTISLPGIFGITLIYLFIIIMVLIFARTIFTDLSEGTVLSNVVAVGLGVGMPLFLIAMLVYQVTRVVRERRMGNPGSRYKVRLLLFFVIVTLVASVPQAVLSVSFLDTAINTWFSADLGRSLEGGLNVALSFNRLIRRNLQQASSSTTLLQLMLSIPERGEAAWLEIQRLNDQIDALQVFSSTGEETVSLGPPEAKVAFSAVEGRVTGFLDRSSRGDVLSFVRFLPNTGSRIVLTGVLPIDYRSYGLALTESRSAFLQFRENSLAFRFVLSAFYIFFSVPMVLLALLISFLLSDEIIRPILNLEEATKRVTEGDYSFRIVSRSNDELAVLIDSFNSMVSELEKSRTELIQTEKVSAWQEIAQRLAHEIKNPLTPIKLSAQRLLAKAKNNPEDLPRITEPAVSSIIREVESLNALLEEFRNFSRLPEPDPALFNLAELIEEITSLHHTEGIDFDVSMVPKDLAVRADRKQLRQVLTNLLANAVHAMESAGTVAFAASLARKGNTQYCRIRIRDDGPGIPEEHRNRIFHPYFTTKSQGTGLGLAVVERIINDHHGMIWFETEDGVGTTFYIDLPTGAT
jgi:two-component system nitrogen regulation sensor histidine kinase NtrY